MRIYIQKPYASGIDHAKIFVIDEQGTSRFEVTIDKESGHLQQTKLDEESPRELKPFLSLPNNFFEAFVKAVCNFAQENNIKTDNESVLHGKFSATKEHLEDMRKLVFKYFGNGKPEEKPLPNE